MSVFKKTSVLILALLLWNQFIEAQNETHIIKHLSTKQGLSSNIVSAIIQDNFGYIWIGTANGIDKYNGYSFEKYNKRDGILRTGSR